jgi:hypothetical protein
MRRARRGIRARFRVARALVDAFRDGDGAIGHRSRVRRDAREIPARARSCATRATARRRRRRHRALRRRRDVDWSRTHISVRKARTYEISGARENI